MQEYLQLQNKLRKELANRWIEYYQVDGLAKQKGNSIKFTPSTALQGIMYEISKQLEEMEQSLKTKFPNETDNQRLERNKMQVNDKFSKLVEQHKNATKNGILGKDETWDKLINRFPELKSFVKKYGHLRANENILNSLSDNVNDYETNVAKANLAREYESSEFADIIDFIRRQRDKIELMAERQKIDDDVINLLAEKDRQAQIEEKQRNDADGRALAEKRAQYLQLISTIPVTPQIKDDDRRTLAEKRAQYIQAQRENNNRLQIMNEIIAPDYSDDDAETIVAKEQRKQRKNRSDSPSNKPIPKSNKKETSKPHTNQLTGKKSRPSKTPDDTDDYEQKLEARKRTLRNNDEKGPRVEEYFDDDYNLINGNDDDEPQVTTYSRTDQYNFSKEQQKQYEEESAQVRGFDSVTAMKKHDQREKQKQKALERYHSLDEEGRQRIRNQQNTRNAKKKNKNKNQQQYREKDPFFDYDDNWDEGTPEQGFFYENEFINPPKALDIQSYAPNVTKSKNVNFKPHTAYERKRALKQLTKVKDYPYELDDVDEHVYKNPEVKNALETLEGLGKKKKVVKGRGKKPEPMKTTTKKHTNQTTTQAPRQVTFSTQLPPGITNN